MFDHVRLVLICYILLCQFLFENCEVIIAKIKFVFSIQDLKVVYKIKIRANSYVKYNWGSINASAKKSSPPTKE